MELVEIAMPDGIAEGYLARGPAGEVPGVILFMDALGVRPQIARMADRIASWGYVVLAPNVFYREGSVEEIGPPSDLREPGARESFLKKAMPRVRALTPARAVADLDAYLAALRGIAGVATGPFGVTGYCMGARLAIRAGTAHPDEVAAVAGFHGGGLATEVPDSPHLGLGHARAAFVFGHADHDRSMAPDAVARLGEALSAAGLDAVNEVYAGAAHGYTMADTSAYDEAASERHFRALEELFARTL